MTKREINLEVLTNKNEFVSFLNNIPAEKFVSIHQDCFKDHYLYEPELDLNEFIDEFDMFDVIAEKYREFFNELGLEAAYEWLREEVSLKLIKYEIGQGDGDLEEEEYDGLEVFYNLYGESWSTWGYSAFMNEFFTMFFSEKN